MDEASGMFKVRYLPVPPGAPAYLKTRLQEQVPVTINGYCLILAAFWMLLLAIVRFLRKGAN
jgi:hypothetical protein